MCMVSSVTLIKVKRIIMYNLDFMKVYSQDGEMSGKMSHLLGGVAAKLLKQLFWFSFCFLFDR